MPRQAGELASAAGAHAAAIVDEFVPAGPHERVCPARAGLSRAEVRTLRDVSASRVAGPPLLRIARWRPARAAPRCGSAPAAALNCVQQPSLPSLSSAQLRRQPPVMAPRLAAGRPSSQARAALASAAGARSLSRPAGTPQKGWRRSFCRQASASLLPGVTPEQLDMKSETQLARIAHCWALVTCAWAVAIRPTSANHATARTGICIRKLVFVTVFLKWCPGSMLPAKAILSLSKNWVQIAVHAPSGGPLRPSFEEFLSCRWTPARSNG
jgi:hypothetical protein